MTRWQRMCALAQEKANTGAPVLVVSAGGNYLLKPEPKAVDAVLKRLEGQ